MAQQEQVTNRIFTLANVVSFIRLCMVPAYLVFLLEGHDVLAAFMFALAASTDFIDGQLARRTHTVSRLGQLLDPAVDRILVVIVRDLFLLCGAAFLLRYKKRVAVVFPGKVATTLLFVGFAGLLLNFPLIDGLGVCDASWLPGFDGGRVSWGIWFVYAGLALALATTVVYIHRGWQALQEARAQQDA